MLAGFDLTTNNIASGDDTTRPRRRAAPRLDNYYIPMDIKWRKQHCKINFCLLSFPTEKSACVKRVLSNCYLSFGWFDEKYFMQT
jgi:hypothetical protein